MILVTTYNDLKFKIVKDSQDIGAYLYIYKNDQCIYDYLQNSIEVCKTLALEDFEVPMDKWVEVTS